MWRTLMTSRHWPDVEGSIGEKLMIAVMLSAVVVFNGWLVYRLFFCDLM